MKTILIISTLDTKGKETLYLKEKLESLNIVPLLMDISMRKGEDIEAADIPSEKVASAAGTNIQQIYESKDRAKVTNLMIKGARNIARNLIEKNEIDGVIGIGGSTGSLMATDVMRSLPFGIPKLMISSTAALPGLSTRYIGTADIMLFHTVIEISGVTDLLKNVIDRGAYAVAGMIKGQITPLKSDKGKAVALTMLGACEKCASRVRKALENEGFQVIGFSASGIGDRAMEEMILQGYFQAVIDLAPGGVGEHLFGFTRDAGPNRMESAGKIGIPQIISTCSVNHITPAKSKYKPEYYQRRKYDLDKFRTWLRISPEELRIVAEAFAEKLNRAIGPVKVLIPLNGWSSVDASGNPTYDPKEDRIFNETLKRLLRPEIEIREINANMEDPKFADAIIEAFREVINMDS